MESSNDIYYVIPIILTNAGLMEAGIRIVKTDYKGRKGLASIYTESFYTPLENLGHMTLDEAKKKLAEVGAIEVSADFDRYDIDHLKSIKQHLSQTWIDTYNSYTPML